MCAPGIDATLCVIPSPTREDGEMATCTEVRPGATGTSAVDDRIRPGTRRLLAACAVLTALAPNPPLVLAVFAVRAALATSQLVVLGGHTDRFWPWTI